MTSLNIGKKNSKVLIYYLMWILVYIAWGYLNIPLNSVVCLLVWAAIIVPTFFLDTTIFLVVFSTFYLLARYNYSSVYLPTNIYTYVGTYIAFIIIRGKELKGKINPLIMALFLITLFRNFFDSAEIIDASLCFLLLIMFIHTGNLSSKETTTLFSWAFMSAGVALSIYHIIFGDTTGMQSWREGELVDRYAFYDINYGGSIIALCICMVLIYLFNFEKKSNLFRMFAISSVVLMSVSLILNASRASILAVVFCLVLLILNSKAKIYTKLFAVIVAVLFAFVVSREGVLDYLVFRFTSDDGTGGSRTYIWQHKLYFFSANSDIIHFLFGYGYDGGRNISGGIGVRSIAFHNDFLAFLCEYGFIGFVLFSLFFLYPLAKSIKGNRLAVIAGLLSLFVITFTLEPFAAGRLPFFSYWYFLYALGKKPLTVTCIESQKITKR